jgi:hypothetical protein
VKGLTATWGTAAWIAALLLATGPLQAQEYSSSAGETVPADTMGDGTTSTGTNGGEMPANDPAPLTGPQSVPQNRIAGEFREFLGPDSETVVSSLRRGESFTLTETTPGATPDQRPETTTVTIDPPTGNMGNGNVRHTLRLAEFQLAQAGIEEPTASQLQAALTGGSVTNADGTTTELPGVLTLRSEGMGWGQIAKERGTKLGWIKNGRASVTATGSDGTGGEVLDPGETGTDAGGEAGAGGGETTGGELAGSETGAPGETTGGKTAGAGITDAAGNVETARTHGAGRAAAKTHTSRGRGTGSSDRIVTGTGRASSSRGRGIVDGLGASAGGTQGHGHGKGSGTARGRGIVTGTGHSASGRGRGIVDGLGGSAGGSRGGGHGRGHGVVNAMGGAAGGGHGGGAAHGRGIVNGLGASSHGRGGGSHIVTGTGSSSGSRGGGHGGGHGHGHGHGKGK